MLDCVGKKWPVKPSSTNHWAECVLCTIIPSLSIPLSSLRKVWKYTRWKVCCLFASIFFYQIFLEIRNKILWIRLIFINLTNVTYLLEHQFFDFKKIKTRGTCFYLILSLDRYIYTFEDKFIHCFNLSK